MTLSPKFSRSLAALLSAGALMIPLLASCGGGGSSGPKTSRIDTATPAPTSSSTSCGQTFTPNYASSVTLLRFQGFPLRLFFKRDDQYSASRQATALAGFNQWVSATGGRANYSVVSNASNANVTVSFYQFTGGAGDTLGTTTVNYRGNVIETATLELGITGDAVDDKLTAAHEYGHALGISGHSPDKADLMYFTGNVSGQITTSDLNTILTAYCNNFSSTNRTSAPTGPLKTMVMH